jgi:hypothetical protein
MPYKETKKFIVVSISEQPDNYKIVDSLGFVWNYDAVRKLLNPKQYNHTIKAENLQEALKKLEF